MMSSGFIGPVVSVTYGVHAVLGDVPLLGRLHGRPVLNASVAFDFSTDCEELGHAEGGEHADDHDHDGELNERESLAGP